MTDYKKHIEGLRAKGYIPDDKVYNELKAHTDKISEIQNKIISILKKKVDKAC